MEFQISLTGLMVAILLYWTEMTGKTKMSEFVFSFSNCERSDQVRKLFMTIFLLCLIYRTWIAFLKRFRGVKGKNNLDFMGYGQQPILFGFGTWQITHILLYLWYGYICPSDWKFALMIGTLFEVLEFVIGNTETILGIDDKRYWTTGNNTLNTKDIIANTIGFSIGSLLNRLI